MKRWKHVACAVSVAAIVTAGDLSAQIQYATGQNVAPIYEGWMKNADGSIDMVFGYLNRNWEEILNIPVGADNNVTPGGPDRGQPTVFVPRRIAQPPGERRQQFVFRIRVPKDWRKDQEMVWTLTAHGRTDKAIGHLDPLLEMDNDVIAMNRGGGLGVEKNEPPSVKLTASAQTVAQSGQVTLTALVSDDGLPKQRGGGGGAAAVAQALAGGAQAPTSPTRGAAPAPGAANRPQGLHVRWIHYRGPGKVAFTPARSPVDGAGGAVKDGKATATASFSEPGVYVLRAFADDTSLFGTAEVTVTVSGGSQPAGERAK
jgi:hypothetical protein